jgi:hypothetical protein
LIEFLFTTYPLTGRDLVAQLRPTGRCNCPIIYLNQLTLGNGEPDQLAARQTEAFRAFLEKSQSHRDPEANATGDKEEVRLSALERTRHCCFWLAVARVYLQVVEFVPELGLDRGLNHSGYNPAL